MEVADVSSIQAQLNQIKTVLDKVLNAVIVNQELVRSNLILNEECKKHEITPVPSIKLDQKLSIVVSPYNSDELLLTGCTFDVKDMLKSICGAFWNSERRGWIISATRLNDALNSTELTNVCVFDTTALKT